MPSPVGCQALPYAMAAPAGWQGQVIRWLTAETQAALGLILAHWAESGTRRLQGCCLPTCKLQRKSTLVTQVSIATGLEENTRVRRSLIPSASGLLSQRKGKSPQDRPFPKVNGSQHYSQAQGTCLFCKYKHAISPTPVALQER